MKHLTRLFIFILVILIASPVLAMEQEEIPFEHWSYDAIKTLSTKGVLTGVPVSALTGERQMTRYEVAVVLSRAMDRLGEYSEYVDDEDMQLYERLMFEFSEDLRALDVKVLAVRQFLDVDDINARLEALERRETSSLEGFKTVKGCSFKLKGELELEAVDTDGSGVGVAESNPHLKIDKLVLQPVVVADEDNFTLDTQLWLMQDGVHINEIHAIFKGMKMIGDDPWLDIGLYERWQQYHFRRLSEAWSIHGIAFFMDDALTITLGSEFGPFYWTVSAGGGYELGLFEVSEDTGNDQQIIHDNRAFTGVFKDAEYGFNVGFKLKGLDILGFYYRDRLSDNDITNLKTWLNYTGDRAQEFARYGSYLYDYDKDDKYRAGLGVKYEWAGWKLASEYVQAVDGKLGRLGYSLELSKHFPIQGHKWFTGVRPLFGWSYYDVDDAFDRKYDLPATWDREKTILALLFDLTKNTTVKTEYYINKEWNGTTEDVNNDEIMMQLELRF